jgi:hypothetical protein
LISSDFIKSSQPNVKLKIILNQTRQLLKIAQNVKMRMMLNQTQQLLEAAQNVKMRMMLNQTKQLLEIVQKSQKLEVSHDL